jgi:capsular polysaccharide transport system permease protein
MTAVSRDTLPEKVSSRRKYNSPARVQQRKARALEEQIAVERTKISTDKTGLASRIARYERLSLEREFSNRMLSTAELELVRARNEATRQLLYLERLVEPHVADYSTEPKRFRSVLTVFAANALGALVLWLLYSGIKEHVSDTRN